MTPCSCSPRLLVLLKLFVLACLFVGMTRTSKAQDKFEVFGGYSYLRASIEVGQFGPVGSPPTRIAQHANLNGWELSGQYKFLPFVGAIVDFDGNYGTLDGASTHEHTYLFGLQASLPTKVSPFAHALIGIAKESQDSFFNPAFFSLGADKSLATAVGVGIDVKAAPFIKVRLIQVDYLRTQLHGTTQNQPRVSAGVVVHF